MATQVWRTNVDLAERLQATPQHFDFLQALRIIELLMLQQQSNCEYIGVETTPHKEWLQLKHNASFSFPGTEVSAIDLKNNNQGDSHWQVTSNLFGLLGSMGVLPFIYSELVLQRERQRDHALKDFLDQFNHRSLSLFYRAASKYRLPVVYHRHQLKQKRKHRFDPITRVLMSLVGLGLETQQDRLPLRDEVRVQYFGLLSQQRRNASGLQQILRHHFSVPATIEQFKGQWLDLMVDTQIKLPGLMIDGHNHCLGENTVLGQRCWALQSKFRVKIGPLSKSQYQAFAPGSQQLATLRAVIQLYAGNERDFDIVISIDSNILPPLQLKKTPDYQPQLAWNSLLHHANCHEPLEITAAG